MWKFEAKILKKTLEVIKELMHCTIQYRISNPVEYSKRIFNPARCPIKYLTRLDIRNSYIARLHMRFAYSTLIIVFALFAVGIMWSISSIICRTACRNMSEHVGAFRHNLAHSAGQ